MWKRRSALVFALFCFLDFHGILNGVAAANETGDKWEEKIDLTDEFFQNTLLKFSPFNIKIVEKVRPIAEKLFQVDSKEFWGLADFLKSRISPSVYRNVLNMVLANRADVEGTPFNYLANFNVEVNEEDTEDDIELTEDKVHSEKIVELDYTPNDNDVESQLWYFREDLGMNLFHNLWHTIYGGKEGDRRGELFFYFHRQVLSRYNFERLANGLNLVVPLTNLKEPIKESYYPRLFGLVDADDYYSGRDANTPIVDVNRTADYAYVTVAAIERLRNKFLKAIEDGYLVSSTGEKRYLDEETGTNILLNTLESSALSENKPFYGSFHNSFHILVSNLHDPLFEKQLPSGVVSSTATAMRDPAFYRLHGEVDRIVQVYKNTLTAYTEEQLTFDGVKILSAGVSSKTAKNNVIDTFYERTIVNLTEGLDFDSSISALARYTHIQHMPFNFSIEVESKQARNGTVRIFLAPKLNGQVELLSLKDQREALVELDKFYVSLKAGVNTISRRSVDSSVSTSNENTFKDTGVNNKNPDLFMGCGLPHNLLIPRGNVKGQVAQLFIMITDNNYDQVKGTDLGSVGNNNALSICGLIGQKYPDRRAMGYPFDRPARKGVNTLKDFLTPNMIVTDITLKHSGVTMDAKKSYGV